MKNSIRQALLLLLLGAISTSSLANYKCTDSQGRNTYQEQPCKTGNKQQTLVFETHPTSLPSKNQNETVQSATSLVSLNKAEVFQQGPNPRNGNGSFWLRPYWTNLNKTKVSVNYRVRFLDWNGIELYISKGSQDIEASSSSKAPKMLATFDSKPSDRFNYKEAASATITFSAKGEKEEKVIKTRIIRE